MYYQQFTTQKLCEIKRLHFKFSARKVDRKTYLTSQYFTFVKKSKFEELSLRVVDHYYFSTKYNKRRENCSAERWYKNFIPNQWLFHTVWTLKCLYIMYWKMNNNDESKTFFLSFSSSIGRRITHDEKLKTIRSALWQLVWWEKREKKIK